MPEIFKTDIKVKQTRLIIVDSPKGHTERREVTLTNEDGLITLLGKPDALNEFIQSETVTIKISQSQTQISEEEKEGEEVDGGGQSGLV